MDTPDTDTEALRAWHSTCSIGPQEVTMLDLFNIFDSIDGARYCHYSDELGVLFVWYGGKTIAMFHRYNVNMEPISSLDVNEDKPDNPTREQVHDEIINFIKGRDAT